MKSADEIENFLKNAAIGTDPAIDEAVLGKVLVAHEKTTNTKLAAIELNAGRIVMQSPIRKLAAAVVILAVVALSVMVVHKVTSPAYAIEQTAEALKDVRLMHLVQRDKAGNVVDERWVEIDSNGYQARYRQDTPSKSFFVVDNRETVMVHHKDKNTVVLYDPAEKSWTWHYAPGKMFDEIAEGDGPSYTVIAENVKYKGRLAHQLQTVIGDTDVYIDPRTKLPISHGDYEFDYENPPEDIFDIVIPEGVLLVDKRPGAEPGPEPEWMVEERQKEELGDIAQGYFEEARRALAAGDYAGAIEMFDKSLEIAPLQNWASLWMGIALHKAGDYDAAIYWLTKIIDSMAEKDISIPSYFLARAMAYQAKGMTDMARLDAKKVLPKMIVALRKTNAARSFDLADDPLIRADGMREECHDGPTEEQSTAMMINRLRTITGQNFGYDPSASREENEAAITVWERWLEDDGRIRFSPDAELVPIPPLPEPVGQ